MIRCCRKLPPFARNLRGARPLEVPLPETTISRSMAMHSKNPYRILGLPQKASMKTVQKKFLQLALQHHPDTKSSTADSISSTTPIPAAVSKNTTAADFIRVRQAFEKIRDAHQRGVAVGDLDPHEEEDDSSSQGPAAWTENDFLDYFHKQTGVRLTSDQRRELVHLYRTRTPGYHGGHSWELARRLVAEQDAFLKNMQAGGAPPRPGRNRRQGSQRRDSSSFDTGESSSTQHSSLRRQRKR